MSETTSAPAAPATPSSTPAPTPAPSTPPASSAPSTIAENYDTQGRQVVDDGVLDFDVPEKPEDDTPLVEQHIDAEEDELMDAIVEDEPKKNPEKTETPKDQPPANQPPATPEPKLLAGKFNSKEDLENAFINLGGDPAEFTDPKMLEQAYLVRQREFSRSRAEINNQTPPPPAPKTVEELMQEEFKDIDPANFKGPTDMWQAMMKGMGNVINQVNDQIKNSQPQPIDPKTIDNNIQAVRQLESLKSQVPRLKTDPNFKRSFGLHILQLREQGIMPRTKEGHEDVRGAFKSFIQAQKSVVDEVLKNTTEANNGKDLSSTVNNDAAPENPGGKRVSQSDAILDGLMEAHDAYEKKYL